MALNGSYMQIPLLKLTAPTQACVGRVHLRVGGNAQHDAALVPSLADGNPLGRQQIDTRRLTNTPVLPFRLELLMCNISALVNTTWHIGVSLDNTFNLRLTAAEDDEQIFGDNLSASRLATGQTYMHDMDTSRRRITRPITLAS
ncbi:hypothetical protein B0H21DRAFT_550139 [Amylocystis lapponica]|nr:hypothetical protein B0H21DRAFT_550139 [Amylocystis lapponica]